MEETSSVNNLGGSPWQSGNPRHNRFRENRNKEGFKVHETEKKGNFKKKGDAVRISRVCRNKRSSKLMLENNTCQKSDHDGEARSGRKRATTRKLDSTPIGKSLVPLKEKWARGWVFCQDKGKGTVVKNGELLRKLEDYPSDLGT